MEKKIDSHYVVGAIAKVLFSTLLILFVGSFFFPLIYKSINYEWVRVAHPDYGFAYSYPTKWKNEFFGESGYRGFEEAKAQLRNSPHFGPGILVLVVPYNNPTADSIEEWNRLNWHGQAVLIEENIAGKPAWRAQRYYKNDALKELIYFAREDDFIVIMIDGKEHEIDNIREDIERFLISFEPFREK